jgi:hypothetical protein
MASALFLEAGWSCATGQSYTLRGRPRGYWLTILVENGWKLIALDGGLTRFCGTFESPEAVIAYVALTQGGRNG